MFLLCSERKRRPDFTKAKRESLITRMRVVRYNFNFRKIKLKKRSLYLMINRALKLIFQEHCICQLIEVQNFKKQDLLTSVRYVAVAV